MTIYYYNGSYARKPDRFAWRVVKTVGVAIAVAWRAIGA